MTKIDLDNGVFYLNGQFFQPHMDNEGTNSHKIGENLYSNLSISGTIKNIPFKATGYYQNKNLKSITLSLEQEYLKKNYLLPSDFDFRDYLTPYINFCKKMTEELLDELINSKKRKFEWGKIRTQIDPRGPFVYGEITYNKIS